MDSFVYVIKAPEGVYKIGRSVDPLKRLESLNTGRSDRALELVCAVRCRFASALESLLHQRFGLYRLKGEWFQLTDADLVWIAGLEKALQRQPDHIPYFGLRTSFNPPRISSKQRQRSLTS